MVKYRVNSENGFVEFSTNGEECLNYHAQYGIGEIQIIDIKPVWDKEAYVEAINQAHTDWYRSIYTRKPDLDYSSIGEIGLYLNHPEFSAQAQALQQLWWDSVDILYAHLEEVTEETAQPIETFINSLPKFNH